MTATPARAVPDRSVSGACLYVYGIVDDCFRFSPSPADVTLQLHRVDGVAAVYSWMDVAEFDDLAPELAEGSKLATIARRHDRVVRGIAHYNAVLPVRLGTLFPDLWSLTGLLAETSFDLRAQLDRIRGRRQWALRIRPVSPLVASLPPAEHAASGTEYLQHRRHDRQQKAQLRESRLAAMSAADEALAGRAESVAGQGLSAQTVSLSRAYLVREEMAAEFIAVAEEVAVEVERRGCDTRLSGPLPAYSFVDVRLEVRTRV